MAKILFFLFSIGAFLAMWGMYNVDGGVQLCMAILILSLAGLAISANEWENQIKKK